MKAAKKMRRTEKQERVPNDFVGALSWSFNC